MGIRVFTLICFMLFVSLVVLPQKPDDDVRPIIDDIFLAKVNDEGRAGERAESFVVTDVPIFCVVRLHSPGVADIKMELVATKVTGIERDTPIVSVSYTTKPNEDRVNFSGKPQDVWAAGNYRADIYIGSKIVRRIEFEIRSTPGESVVPPKSTRPAPSRKIVKRKTVAERFAF